MIRKGTGVIFLLEIVLQLLSHIEARLSKFALDVVFNPKTTEWQASYDGRRKEPINLPVKFPLLLAQGAEGIAVGLSTKGFAT